MNNDNHKTLQEFAMGEIIKELRAERDALKAELEAAKENHRIHAARLISEKILVSEQIEAARKQEPIGEVCGTFKGAYSVGNVFFPECGPLPDHTKLYASPVPAQQPEAPIAFTENDLLEIASSYSAYAGADGDMYLNGWVKSYEAKGFISLINNRQRGQVMAEQLLKGGENEPDQDDNPIDEWYERMKGKYL